MVRIVRWAHSEKHGTYGITIRRVAASAFCNAKYVAGELAMMTPVVLSPCGHQSFLGSCCAINAQQQPGACAGFPIPRLLGLQHDSYWLSLLLRQTRQSVLSVVQESSRTASTVDIPLDQSADTAPTRSTRLMNRPSFNETRSANNVSEKASVGVTWARQFSLTTVVKRTLPLID